MNLRTSKLNIKKLTLADVTSNCYIIEFLNSKKAVVIDPGSQPEKIRDYLEKKGLNVIYIINTHGHFDHIGGNNLENLLKNKPKLVIHKDDAECLSDPSKNFSEYFGSPFVSPAADIIIEKDCALEIDPGLSLTVFHTPGHSPGGICIGIDKFLFTGDTIFAGTVGRSDIPGGNEKHLYSSVKKILQLPQDTIILPGHGGETTIKKERGGFS